MSCRNLLWLGLCFGLGSLAFGCEAERLCPPNACPTGTTCRVLQDPGKEAKTICLQIDIRSDLGGRCEGQSQRCLSELCYTPLQKVEESYCTRVCTQTADCPAGYSCQSVGGAVLLCLRPSGSTPPPPTQGCRCKTEGGTCVLFGHDDCAIDKGFFCLSSGPKDTQAICVQECDPTDPQACKDGFFCSRSVTGRFFCVERQFKQEEIGGNCTTGGKAQCKPGNFCKARWDSDPQAFCTKYCSYGQDDECPSGFLCEYPSVSESSMCLPRGSKGLGDDCSQEGFQGCRSAICVHPDRRKPEAVCSQICDRDHDQCPLGFTCLYLSHAYRYLCLRSVGGPLGSLCNKNGSLDCRSGICVLAAPGALNKICSEACDDSLPCPPGFSCDKDKQICFPKTGNKPIGETCQDSEECIFGTCYIDTQGQRFCTQICREDSQCPDGFACLPALNLSYCLPRPSGQKEIGDPCPNGPNDCASQVCIADPLQNRTFCSAPCNDQQPCPSPLICKAISDQVSFCTPADYQAP